MSYSHALPATHGGVDISAKIETFMSNKQYYEAEQLFMTQVNRAVAQKNYATADDLAQRGIQAMLTVAQAHVSAHAPSSVKSAVLAAGELGKLYISALKRSGAALSESVVDDIIRLGAAMAAVRTAAEAQGAAYNDNDESGERASLPAISRVAETFLREAQEWVADTAAAASDASYPSYGSPRIEAARAAVVELLRGPIAAQPHYARAFAYAASAGSAVDTAYATTFATWLKAQRGGDADWSLAQCLRGGLYAVALALEGTDLRGANAVAAAVEAAFPSAEVAASGSAAAAALREFTAQLLALARCDKAAAPLFESARKAAAKKGVFEKEGEEAFPLSAAVAKVGAALFDVQPPRGMLEELLGISNIGDLFKN